jgi:hypothetical protein
MAWQNLAEDLEEEFSAHLSVEDWRHGAKQVDSRAALLAAKARYRARNRVALAAAERARYAALRGAPPEAAAPPEPQVASVPLEEALPRGFPRPLPRLLRPDTEAKALARTRKLLTARTG